MKLDPTIRATLAHLQPNQIGMMAWTLLANPLATHQAGGLPGQPDPDIPYPAQPEEPSEPGEPTLPDQPPPTPMA